MNGLNDFFSGLRFSEAFPQQYAPNQLGTKIVKLYSIEDQIEDVDIVIIGCGGQRGAGLEHTSLAPDAIRSELYQLYCWHDTLRIGDAGNLILGATIGDSYSALATVCAELIQAGKKIIILGGSHDLTLGQYKAYQRLQRLCNVAVIDAKIDLLDEESVSDKGFLMELLTGRNNFVRQYTHLGFQSYLVDPNVLQTMDHLRFDCVRLGVLKEDMSLVEPDLRGANMVSIDMMALRQSEVPYLRGASANGLFNQELCELTRFAAMNNEWHSIGFYGYQPENDVDDVGAKAIAQAIWYLFDGWYAQQMEAPLDNKDAYETHEMILTEIQTQFLKSKRTGRWWMQIADGSFIPCSYKDYLIAASNDIPERWLRANERIV